MNGYSDPINHALAFAAKHHDQQVRRGTRLPYITAAPNVAVILTRYGRDDMTVVAGILHDVVRDYVREGFTREMLDTRIAQKFGAEVLTTLISVVERRYDDDGVELSPEERRGDLLERLAQGSERGLWVVTADLVHAAGTLLSELERTEFPETVWSRQPGGRQEATRWFRRYRDRLAEVRFQAPIVGELGGMVDGLERR